LLTGAGRVSWAYPPSQVIIYWQWYNYYESQVSADKQILRVNLDETSVCYWQGAQPGILLNRKRHIPGGNPAVTNVSRNTLRATMTHVALICDDSTLQPLLPQVLVAKRHLLTKADEARIRATLPANVFLKANPKGWNNSALTCEILNR